MCSTFLHKTAILKAWFNTARTLYPKYFSVKREIKLIPFQQQSLVFFWIAIRENFHLQNFQFKLLVKEIIQTQYKEPRNIRE
jgi:hypothetical protein